MAIKSLVDLCKCIIPINRFNRGEASKIFEEVNEEGAKLVMKSNTPLCVIMSLSEYDELLKASSANKKGEGEN